MATSRIYFTGTIYGSGEMPAYALARDLEMPHTTIAHAIARRSKLRDASSRFSHWDNGVPVYRADLGTFDRDGGFREQGYALFRITEA